MQFERIKLRTKLTHLLSCVMQAWVTIAPSGLSASFDINLPVSKSQTPTQSLVTVAAKLPSSAKLFHNGHKMNLILVV